MALVRVKRRLQDDPIDVLLLSCKKPKTEEDAVTKIFRFAATVDEQFPHIMQSSRKNFQSKEAFHRMNYLYQASDFSRTLSGPDGMKLMLHYGTMLHSVARKTVTRHEISLKRRICKNCHCILVPGNTCIVRLLKKPQQLMWLCVVCGTYKVFNTKPDHIVWTETPEAVVEVINCATSSNASSEENVCGQVDKLILDEHNMETINSANEQQAF